MTFTRSRAGNRFEFEEFSANSYLSLVDEYLYWNKVPGDILLRLKKAAEDALYHHLWYDEKSGYPREYTYKGNDNAILYQILTCADCLDAATDSVGRAYSSGKICRYDSPISAATQAVCSTRISYSSSTANSSSSRSKP